MRDLNGIQRDILFVLAGMDGPHGLAIMDELEGYYQGGINPGRLYPNLDALGEKGHVAKTQADKRTNSYSITNRGRRAIEDRQEWKRQYFDVGTADD